jgi:Do/DeqQ family serine protease
MHHQPEFSWRRAAQSSLLALLTALAACGEAKQPAEQVVVKEIIKEAPAAPAKPATPMAPAKPAAHTTPPPDAPPDGSMTFPSFADLVERSKPAVINIYTRTRLVQRRVPVHPLYGPMVPREQVGESLGSGFIITAGGLALTNHHVIKGATEIEVLLPDERRFKARVVGDDPKTDVALLQIEANAELLPVVPLGDSDKLRVGDWVVAIGNPLGLTSSVTAGIASAVGRRNVPLGGELKYQDFIQTDTPINPGNSGGPLFNTRGEVVGINTAINAEGQGIGFSIPINMVKQILPQLEKTGRVQRSWLGIYVEDIPARARGQLGMERGGALVMEVVPGGPADVAKLQKGDVVLMIADKPVEDASQLSWLAANLGVGRTVPVKVLRNGAEQVLELRLGALPD